MRYHLVTFITENLLHSLERAEFYVHASENVEIVVLIFHIEHEFSICGHFQTLNFGKFGTRIWPFF